MPSVVFVAGARPNFMKIAPILRALPSTFTPLLVHTGQHYDAQLSDVFFDQLGLPEPAVRLGVGSASHGVQTGRIMIALEEWLAARPERPRGVVVVGDVNSTLAGALVAVKRGIEVAHVEAGLRCGDRTMPEEINRIATDAIADVLLVSEPSGMVNLQREGIAADRIHFTGNVMIDSLVQQLDAARALDMRSRFGERYALVTLHRPANVDSPARLTELVAMLDKLAAHVRVVFPVHPRTASRLSELGLSPPGVVAPLPYREFLGAMDAASVVVTDSGGVQEETTFLGVPCVTLRPSTERPITTELGTNVLVGDDLARATSAVMTALATPRRVPRIEGWDGHAAERIAKVLDDVWS